MRLYLLSFLHLIACDCSWSDAILIYIKPTMSHDFQYSGGISLYDRALQNAVSSASMSGDGLSPQSNKTTEIISCICGDQFARPDFIYLLLLFFPVSRRSAPVGPSVV